MAMNFPLGSLTGILMSPYLMMENKTDLYLAGSLLQMGVTSYVTKSSWLAKQ